jgi:glycerol-3-phosphate dehydrogenase
METDVVVIGGGATGTGVTWDLTLRGLRVTLVEMGDVATGTSGRYHGQLHTGARYVTSDLKSAKGCRQEHALAFVCSSTPLVEASAAGLVELEYGPARIKTERFGPTGG